MPIYPVTPDNAMTFHTPYWGKPVANESRDLDYAEYVNDARKNAAQHVKQDTRKQPHPTEPIAPTPELRVITRVGGLLLFSAAHLHSTVPNTSGRTRFSIDFRTAHADDLASRHGAPNVDTECTGTALRDFFRASDLAKPPESLARAHERVAETLLAPRSR